MRRETSVTNGGVDQCWIWILVPLDPVPHDDHEPALPGTGIFFTDDPPGTLTQDRIIRLPFLSLRGFPFPGDLISGKLSNPSFLCSPILSPSVWCGMSGTISDIQELNRLFTTLAYNTGMELSIENLRRLGGCQEHHPAVSGISGSGLPDPAHQQNRPQCQAFQTGDLVQGLPDESVHAVSVVRPARSGQSVHGTSGGNGDLQPMAPSSRDRPFVLCAMVIGRNRSRLRVPDDPKAGLDCRSEMVRPGFR